MMDWKIVPVSPAIVYSNPPYQNKRFDNTLKSDRHLADGKADPELQAACTEMESLFISYLFKEMRATVNKSGFMNGGQSEEIFTTLLDVELSKKISTAGGLGLSKMLLEQLSSKITKKAGPEP